MQTRRLLFWGSIGLSAAVLGTGLVAMARKESAPGSITPSKLAPAPLAVTMNVLATGGRVAMGGRIPVSVEAIGGGVDELTLWDNDHLVATSKRSTAVDGAGHSFEWLALRPGSHLLHASAHGSNGTAHSAPVALEVFITSTTPTELPVTTPRGSTPATLAATTGIRPELIRPDGEQPDPSGVGTRPAFVIDAPAVAQAVAEEMEKSDLTVNTPEVVDDAQPDPGQPDPAQPDPAPTLTIKRTGCSVALRSKGSSTTLVAYHATSGSVGFTEVGKLAKGEALTLDDLGPGSHVFTAGEVGAPTTLAPVSITLGQDCTPSWWKGDASIVNGVLTIAKPTQDALWLFLSADDQPATRLPLDSLQTFRASTRHIDITSWLPHLTGRKLHLEVWAYSPGDKPAAKIGTGDAELPEGVEPAELIGESARSWVQVTPDPAKVKDTTLTAKWSATSPRADRVLWQVTTQPQGEGSTSLTPPGLVASGVSVATGSDPSNGTARTGTFTIPVNALALPAAAPIVSSPVSLQQVGAGKGANLPSAPTKLIDDPKSIDVDALKEAVGDPEVIGGIGSNMPVLSGSTYFVRVLPFSGTAPLGGASPTDRIDLPPPTDPPQAAMTIESIKFDAGRAPNFDLRGCVRVTAVPWTSGQPNGGWLEATVTKAFFPVAGTYCPGDWPSDNSCWAPEVLCDAWNVLAAGVSWVIEQASTLWDLVAAAYNGIIDLAVTIIAKFNPFCIQAAIAAEASDAIGFEAGADVAGAASDLCDTVAPIVARAAVGAVLAVVGLPPALPTSDQLKAMAQGDLVELAVVYLEQLGVPCDDLTIDSTTAGAVSAGVSAAGGEVPAGTSDGVDLCRDALGAALETVKTQVATQAQQQIRDSTGLPLPSTPINGFEFLLEPRGHYRNPSSTITATPVDPATPKNARCDARLITTLVTPSVGNTKAPTFEPVGVSLGRPFFGSTWSASAQFPFNPATGYDGNDYNLSAGTALTSNVSSNCLGDGKSVTVTGAISPLRGRWTPGEDD